MLDRSDPTHIIWAIFVKNSRATATIRRDGSLMEAHLFARVFSHLDMPKRHDQNKGMNLAKSGRP